MIVAKDGVSLIEYICVDLHKFKYHTTYRFIIKVYVIKRILYTDIIVVDKM